MPRTVVNRSLLEDMKQAVRDGDLYIRVRTTLGTVAATIQDLPSINVVRTDSHITVSAEGAGTVTMPNKEAFLDANVKAVADFLKTLATRTV